MISGFVILMSIEKQKSSKKFIRSRIIRIYPIYWVIATFTFVYYYILNLAHLPAPYVQIPFYDYAVNLTMFQYYFNVPNIDGSFWTLIIEVLFYIFMVVIIQFNALKKIISIGIGFSGFIFLYFFAINQGWVSDFSDLFPLLYHFPLFFMGILFYKLFQDKTKIGSYTLLIFANLFLMLYISEYGRTSSFMEDNEYALLLVSFVALFYLFIYGKLKFISNKVTSFLGRISYALYLVHQSLIYGFIIPLLVDVYGYHFWMVTLLIAVPLSIHILC